MKEKSERQEIHPKHPLRSSTLKGQIKPAANDTAGKYAAVLNCVAQKGMAGITVDHVETTVYALLGNRFVEPE